MLSQIETHQRFFLNSKQKAIIIEQRELHEHTHASAAAAATKKNFYSCVSF
jgi:hypothetical protein